MNKIKVILGSLFGSLALVPVVAFGATFDFGSGSLSGVLTSLYGIVNSIIPILIGLGIIAFLWGVLKFIFNAGDEEARKQGKMLMIYGLIGIFVMVSVWGLVSVLQSTFGIDTYTTVQGPVIPTQR